MVEHMIALSYTIEGTDDMDERSALISLFNEMWDAATTKQRMAYDEVMQGM